MGSAVSSNSSATRGGINHGNGAAQGYTISGSMAGTQSGQCATAPAQNTAGGAATVCTNASGARTRTITLVY